MKKMSILKKLLPAVTAALLFAALLPAPVLAVVPSRPTGLMAVTANGGRVDLFWTDNSVDETGFNVQRAPDVGGLGPGTYAQIGPNPTVSANTTTYADATVVALTSYWYRVAAVNGSGNSLFSNEVRIFTPASNPLVTLVTPAPPIAELRRGGVTNIEITAVSQGATVVSADFQVIAGSATGVFDAHDVLELPLDLTVLAARAASPVSDNTAVPAGLPLGTIAEFEIRGTVSSVNTTSGAWQVGTSPVRVYESVPSLPQSTKFAGSRVPIAGDSVKIVAYRTIADGPLVAKTITFIAPAATPAAPTTILSFLYNGVVSTISPPVTAPGYLVSGEVWTIGSGNFRIDAPDFPAYLDPAAGEGASVTVRYAAPGSETNVARNIFKQISKAIQPSIAANPVFDTTPIARNVPSGTWLYVIVDGVVANYDPVNGIWTIGEEGIKCYETAQTLIAPATVGDEVLVYARRTLTPGPLIMEQIHNILPGPLARPYKGSAIETHLMFNGSIQAMGANTWTVGGQAFIVDDPEGKARIDSSPFPAFAIGNPVTVDFEHTGEVLPDDANWAPFTIDASTGTAQLTLPAVQADVAGTLFLRVTDSLKSSSTISVPALLTTGTTVADFDADGKRDLAVYNPANGDWFIWQSSNSTQRIQNWGWSGASAVPSDYDGDGKTDLTVYNPTNGDWFIWQSSNSTQRIQNWGWSGASAVPDDYDGDGKTDLAVYNPANGDWFIWQSSNSTQRIQNWGWSGASAVPGDYDGDGKTDLAVYNPANGDWFIWQSFTSTQRIQNWGWSGATPVPGDYDGDGKTDLAVYNPANGDWFIWQSFTSTQRIQNWGFSGATPVPGDYDGDGKTDLAVYNPANGDWFIWQSFTSTQRIQNWGFSSAIPVP